jgi:hypothetical protein
MLRCGLSGSPILRCGDVVVPFSSRFKHDFALQ